MFDNKVMYTKNTSYVEGSKANATVNNNNLTFGNAVKKTQNASRFITCQIGSLEYSLLFEQNEQYILKDTKRTDCFDRYSRHTKAKGEMFEENNKIYIFNKENNTCRKDRWGDYITEDCYKIYDKIEVEVLQVSIIALNTLLVEVQEKK